jgi:hypothetical protein
MLVGQTTILDTKEVCMTKAPNKCCFLLGLSCLAWQELGVRKAMARWLEGRCNVRTLCPRTMDNRPLDGKVCAQSLSLVQSV